MHCLVCGKSYADNYARYCHYVLYWLLRPVLTSTSDRHAVNTTHSILRQSPAFLCIDTTPVGASRVGGGGGGRGEGHRDLTTSSTLYQPVTPAPSDLSGLSRPRRHGDHLRHLAAVPMVRSIQQDQPPLKSPGKLIRGNRFVIGLQWINYNDIYIYIYIYIYI